MGRKCYTCGNYYEGHNCPTCEQTRLLSETAKIAKEQHQLNLDQAWRQKNTDRENRRQAFENEINEIIERGKQHAIEEFELLAKKQFASIILLVQTKRGGDLEVALRKHFAENSFFEAEHISTVQNLGNQAFSKRFEALIVDYIISNPEQVNSISLVKRIFDEQLDIVKIIIAQKEEEKRIAEEKAKETQKETEIKQLEEKKANEDLLAKKRVKRRIIESIFAFTLLVGGIYLDYVYVGVIASSIVMIFSFASEDEPFFVPLIKSLAEAIGNKVS